MDVLSDVLRSVRLTGAIYFDIHASSPWVAESPAAGQIAASVMPEAEHVISFHAVIAGGCWAALSDGSAAPVRMEAGDVVVFPTGVPNVLSSTPGQRASPNLSLYYRPVDRPLPFVMYEGGGGNESTRLVCGYIGCDAHPFNPLLAALPPVLWAHRPATAGGWVADLFTLALAEGSSQRAGAETVLAKLSELMFVQVIRHHIESLPEHSRGWLSGLRDAHVGSALALIHARPHEHWTLERLAREVGLSRSGFAERFTHFVDVAPMHYLTHWRLQLAARLLERPGVSVGAVGAEIGYESEAAFNRAFKKHIGIPPGAWRRRHEQGGASKAEIRIPRG